jgi:hypothetical protein
MCWQIEHVMDILEEHHPEESHLPLLDNASTHKKCQETIQLQLT